MTIKRAIELAIEGGYQKYSDIEDFLEGKTTYHPIRFRFLDPLFWQALGKAMGWSDNTCNDCGREIKSGTEKIGSGEFNGYHCGCGFQTQPMAVIKGWLYHWHRMIDALSERKSIEQYFESLYEK